MLMIIRNNQSLFLLAIALFWCSVLLPFDVFADRLISDRPQYHTPANLWDRIRNGFGLAVPPDNKAIRKIEIPFTQNPESFKRIIANSERYLFYVVQEVERRGMPMEIALLPFIESAYDPLIKSNSQTAGLWQFMPSTGKTLGLTQNIWHDDRRDIIASTQAALDYLQYLHDKFDNWKLAISAYNVGEAVISRALSRNTHKKRSIDFYDLNLPIEAKHYVYKLLAVKDLIANSGKYGIPLKPIPNRPYFERVKIHEHTDVSLIARLANISDSEFRALNPAYNRYVIKIIDEPRTLLLPTNHKEVFLRNLETYQDPKISWKFYQVRKGENIREIAMRHNTTSQQLQAINGISRGKNVTLGQKILVPYTTDTVLANKHSNGKNDRKPQKHQTNIHIVKKGDTLYHIAKRYGTTIDQLKLWNSSDDENLSIGQKLLVTSRS